jgi:hypothetical protein
VEDTWQLDLHIAERTHARMEVFDMQGKQVMEQTLLLLPGENNFRFSGWNDRAAGLYIIKVRTANEAWSSKLIRQ